MRYYAWWSFYINITSETEIDQAMSHMEGILGQNLKVWDFEEDDFYKEHTGKTRFHVNAWCFLEASNPDQVCVHILKRVLNIASSVFSTHRYNRTATPDDNEMFSFGWTQEDYHHVTQFTSSAVLIGEHVLGYPDLDYLALVEKTPLTTLPPSSDIKQDYVAQYRIRLKAINEDVALRHLWPDIQKDFSSEVTLIESNPCPKAKGYFILTAKQILKDHAEAQAIMSCLALTDNNVLTLEHDDHGQLKSFAGNNKQKDENLGFTGSLNFTLQPLNAQS